MKTHMIKAVLFDCFGVIFSPAFPLWVEKNARREEERDKLLALAGRFDSGDLRLGEFQSEVGKLVGRTSDEVGREIAAESHIDQDVVGLIKRLKQRYRIGILSNIGADVLTNLIERNGLAEFFDVVIASSTLRLVKPNPNLFDYALQQLGFSCHEVVFVDDTDRNVEEAKRHGIESILFHSATQVESDLQKLGALV